MSNPEIEDITIRDDMIRLGQLLKLANLVEDGVEAAELIKNGLVKVNGEIDERRGRQLHDGDTVTVNGRTVRISAPAGRLAAGAPARDFPAARPRRAYFLALSTSCVRNSETWPISCWLMPCHMPV